MVELLLQPVENGPSTGVNSPPVNPCPVQLVLRKHGFQKSVQIARNDVWNVGGKDHVKPGVSDGPGHVVGTLRGNGRGEPQELEPAPALRSAAADDRSPCAVGKQRSSEKLVPACAILEVECTEFGRDDQYPGIGILFANVCGHLDPRNGRVTPHKPEIVPLNIRSQSETSYDIVIGTRGIKPGTGDGEKVGGLFRCDTRTFPDQLPGDRKSVV